MNGRARVSSLAASPTMVGAITTLIVIVAVFLAYNANNGLPFVPVYRVSAEMCNAARLGPNNEVRIGGNRVGVVESIETVDLSDPSRSGQGNTCVTDDGNSASTAAKLNLKLDQSAKPLPEDSTIRVRYRSSFGLKYLEIVRGDAEGMPEGGTLPIEQSEQQTEFDDIGNTFDTPTRENSRAVLEGFGNAFAARGASLNEAIEALNPLFANLRPVSAALADPTTNLQRFFGELADAARIVAPVAEDQAQLFGNAATAFAAISSDEEALRDTISGGPPTLEEGIRSLPIQEPFLRDFAEFSRLLRPGVRDLRASLPTLNQDRRPRRQGPSEDRPAEQGPRGRLQPASRPSSTTPTRRSPSPGSRTPSTRPTPPAASSCPTSRSATTGTTGFSTCPSTSPAMTVRAARAPDRAGPSPERRRRRASRATPSPTTRAARPTGASRASTSSPRRPRTQRPASSILSPPTTMIPPTNIAQPILHGGPYGPAGTEAAPNCQAGQYGYGRGEALSPGQHFDNPSFGIQNISKQLGTAPLGRTDLFLEQDGTRDFWDSP